MERTEIGLLLVKREGTAGTDPTATQALNIIPTVRDQITFDIQGTFTPRMVLDGTLDPVAGHISMPNVQLKFRYELRGNRTNGTDADISAGLLANKIEIDPLLTAAGFNATYTAESGSGARDGNVTYTHLSTPTGGAVEDTVACYWYTDSKIHKLLYGKVDFSIVLEAGKMAYIDFTVVGKYVAVADNEFAFSSAAFLSTKPPIWESGAVSLGGYTGLIVSQATINIGNKNVMRPSGSSTHGIAGFARTGYAPNGRINPESITEAVHPIWADWLANTRKSLILTIGTETGNKFTFTGGTQAKRVSYENQNGLRMQPIEFDIVGAAPSGSGKNITTLKWF